MRRLSYILCLFRWFIQVYKGNYRTVDLCFTLLSVHLKNKIKSPIKESPGLTGRGLLSICSVAFKMFIFSHCSVIDFEAISCWVMSSDVRAFPIGVHCSWSTQRKLLSLREGTCCQTAVKLNNRGRWSFWRSPIYILPWCQEYCQVFEREGKIRIIALDVCCKAVACWAQGTIERKKEELDQVISGILSDHSTMFLEWPTFAAQMNPCPPFFS